MMLPDVPGVFLRRYVLTPPVRPVHRFGVADGVAVRDCDALGVDVAVCVTVVDGDGGTDEVRLADAVTDDETPLDMEAEGVQEEDVVGAEVGDEDAEDRVHVTLVPA